MIKAGFSRVDVTPPLGSYLSGYYYPRFAKGVLDPIQLNAIACNDGEQTVLLIIADFIGVDRYYCDVIREKIAERVSIPVENIMLTSLHQHTSVCIGRRDKYTPNDVFYMQSLYRKYCDVAQMAVEDMKEATAWISHGETEKPIAFIRKYLMTDGTIIGHPHLRQKEIVKRLEDGDNTVRLLRFKREGAKDIAFVNFCTHPDVLSGEYLSADWPGFVRRYVEHDLDGVSCILLNGVQGDSNHCDYLTHETMVKGYDHSDMMGRTIADTVLRIWESGKEMQSFTVGSRVGIVQLPTRTDGLEDYDASLKMLQDLEKGVCDPVPSGAERGRARRIVDIREAPIFQKLPISVQRMGELYIVGFGGEPFTDYAREIRATFPDMEFFTSCCANGYEGYLPSRVDFTRVTYESSSSPFPSDLQDHCVGKAIELINELK